MSFLWPAWLVVTVLVPVIITVLLWTRKRGQRLAARYGGFGNPVSDGHSGFERQLPLAFMLGGMAVLSIAMARPQAVVRLPRLEGTVILAFDVSGSMAADDFKPTRMEAAKAAARDFVAKQPSGVSLGVVAFSDSGFAVQAPTHDRDEVLAAINRLSPQRGTSLANGILTSLQTIAGMHAAANDPHYYSALTPEPTVAPTPMPPGQYGSASIVLLSDGENNESPDPASAAHLAADRGVRIYTIGLGSTEGADLHIEGFIIRSRLDEETLKQLADVTGGAYYRAPTAKDLMTVYDNLNPEITVSPEHTEVTAIFAATGAVMLSIGALASVLMFGRVI